MDLKFTDRPLAKGATVIMGNGYGGEGKTKIFNFLGKYYPYLLRFSCEKGIGKVYNQDNKDITLKVIPIGIAQEDTVVILGSNTPIDLRMLARDLICLDKNGIEVTPQNLKISDQAIVILPFENLFEGQEELQIRMIDMQSRTYEEKLKKACQRLGKDEKKVYTQCLYYCTLYSQKHQKQNQKQRLNQFTCNTQGFLNTVFEGGNEVLVECASSFNHQLKGKIPDYPLGSVLPIEVGSMYVKRVIGVFKAYSTMCGDGIFPTELFNIKKLVAQNLGNEYTDAESIAQFNEVNQPLVHEVDVEESVGKPRRCGWLDLVQVKHCIMSNSQNCLAMTGLDTIGEVGNIDEDLKICIAYSYKSPVNGSRQRITYVPTDMWNVEPIYSETTFEGWHIQPNTHSYEQLPHQAKQYVEFIEDYLEMPISFLGIGPRDEDIIIHKRNM